MGWTDCESALRALLLSAEARWRLDSARPLEVHIEIQLSQKSIKYVRTLKHNTDQIRNQCFV